MHYRTLGRTGIQVSPYALGTMNFGAMLNPGGEDSARIVDRALDGGVNLIGTADVYSGGESEEILGKAIKGRRDDVVLATPGGAAYLWDSGAHRFLFTAGRHRHLVQLPESRLLLSRNRDSPERLANELETPALSAMEPPAPQPDDEHAIGAMRSGF